MTLFETYCEQFDLDPAAVQAIADWLVMAALDSDRRCATVAFELAHAGDAAQNYQAALLLQTQRFVQLDPDRGRAIRAALLSQEEDPR